MWITLETICSPWHTHRVLIGAAPFLYFLFLEPTFDISDLLYKPFSLQVWSIVYIFYCMWCRMKIQSKRTGSSLMFCYKAQLFHLTLYEINPLAYPIKPSLIVFRDRVEDPFKIRVVNFIQLTNLDKTWQEDYWLVARNNFIKIFPRLNVLKIPGRLVFKRN